jgi:hypothetical protein
MWTKDILVGTLLGMHPLLVKGKPVCVKFEQKPLVKNIFIVYSWFWNLMSEHHRDAALLKMIFKQNLVKAFGFVPTHTSLLFYENLFYIRNQEDKRIKRA